MYWMQFRQAYENLFRDIVKVSIPSDDRGTVHREARMMIESGLTALDAVSQKYREDWEKMRKDEYIDVLYTRNREPAMNRWRKEPHETKPYDYINSYVPAPMSENEIKETFKKFEADYPDNDVNFMSSLQTRRDDDDDPPPKRICPVNFHFGQDIEAKYVWGMDCYSRKNIELALSDSWPEMSKSKARSFCESCFTLYVLFECEARECRFFMFQFFHINYRSITRIAHSYSNSQSIMTNARTQVL